MALTELSEAPIRSPILLIRKTLEHAGEHLLFSFGEWPCSIVRWDFDLSPESRLQLLLVQPYLASHHVTDSLCKRRLWVALVACLAFLAIHFVRENSKRKARSRRKRRDRSAAAVRGSRL